MSEVFAKPCPFCGKPAVTEPCRRGDWTMAHCSDDDCVLGYDMEFGEFCCSVADWNRRPIEDKLSEVAEDQMFYLFDLEERDENLTDKINDLEQELEDRANEA